MANRYVTDEQLLLAMREVLYNITFQEFGHISKNVLKKNLDETMKTVNKLDIIPRQTHVTTFQRNICIPVKQQDSNKSPFDVNISFALSGAKSCVFGLYIPPNFSGEMSLNPVIKFMSKDLRGVLDADLTVNYVEVRRPSLGGVPEHYYVLDCNKDVAIDGNMYIDIENYEGITDVKYSVTNGEANTTINVIKTTTIKVEPIVGFDDIPERDILMRSKSAKYIEVVTEGQYQILETTGKLDESTIYNVEERSGVNEPTPETNK